MKRFIFVLAATLFLFSFTQCHKDEEMELASQDGETSIVSLTVRGIERTRANIVPNEQDAALLDVTWKADDRVYVFGAESGYLGTLFLDPESDGLSVGRFRGEISKFDTQVLHFLYLGEKTKYIRKYQKTVSIDFSDQDGSIESIADNHHIAFGSSNGPTQFNNILNLAVVFQNTIAIAYFDCCGFDGTQIKLFGNTVYKTMKIEIDKNGELVITGQDVATEARPISVGAPCTNGKYLALIPAENCQMKMKGKTTACEFTPINIEAGVFYSLMGETLPTVQLPEGSLNGIFSVSPTKHIRFSKGNLHYLGSLSSPCWKFAEQQYECLLTSTGQNSDSQNVDRDLFGWGTSGLLNLHYNQPWQTSSFSPSYGPSIGNLDGKWDWGYNAIANGGNLMSSWRTLSGSVLGEWYYLINIRKITIINENEILSNQTGFGFGSILIDGSAVSGLFLLPDEFVLPIGLSFATGNKTNNQFTVDQWLALESAGVVFLPDAGIREKTSLSLDGGFYWSSTVFTPISAAYYLNFQERKVNSQDVSLRSKGYAVRLVMDVD